MAVTFENYPHFEANQVLSSRHLNDMRDFLDRQNRNTRSKLIGTGIASGLGLNFGSNLTLQPGVGITSMGYLISIADVIDFPYVLEMKNLAPFASITNILATAYSQTSGLPTKADTAKGRRTRNQTPQIWELLTANDIPGVNQAEIKSFEALGGGFFRNKVVLIYQEQVRTELKSCYSNTCDDKGSEFSFRLRFLLINQSDAEILYSRPRKSRFLEPFRTPELPALNIPQIQFPENPKAQEDIHESLIKILNNYIPQLRNTLNQAYQFYYSLFPDIQVRGNSPIDSAFQRAKWNENGFHQAGGAANDAQRIRAKSVGIHHVYDLCRAITQAYMELRQHLYNMLTILPKDFHPEHSDFILLGQIASIRKIVSYGNELSGEATDKAPNILSGLEFNHLNFRHHFLPARKDESIENHREELNVLFYRIFLMISEAQLPTGRLSVTITPTQDHGRPLGEQSIPYYLSQSSGIRRVWNPLASRQKWQHQLLSFHAKNYNQQDDFVLNPLKYNHSQYPWYRVEGYLGQPLTEVLNSIRQQIKEHRLPIFVKALAIGGRKMNAEERQACLSSSENIRYEEKYLEARLAMISHLRNIQRFFTFSRITVSSTEHDVKAATGKGIINEISTKNGLGKEGNGGSIPRELFSLNQSIQELLDFLEVECLPGFKFEQFQETYFIFLEQLVRYAVLSQGFLIKIVTSLITTGSPLQPKGSDGDSGQPMFGQPGNAVNQVWHAIKQLIIDPVHYRELQWAYLYHQAFLSTIEEVRVDDFSQFLKEYPGPNHIGGVSKGGTLLLITQSGNDKLRVPIVLEDYYIPYCCTKKPQIAAPDCKTTASNLRKLVATLKPWASPEMFYTPPNLPINLQLLTADDTLFSEAVQVKMLEETVREFPYPGAEGNPVGKHNFSENIGNSTAPSNDILYSPKPNFRGIVVFQYIGILLTGKTRGTVYILVDDLAKQEPLPELNAFPITATFNSGQNNEYIEVLNSPQVDYDPSEGPLTLSFTSTLASGGQLPLPSGNIARISPNNSGFFIQINSVTKPDTFDSFSYTVKQGTTPPIQASSTVTFKVSQRAPKAKSETVGQLSYATNRVKSINLSTAPTFYDPKAEPPQFRLDIGNGFVHTFPNGNKVTLTGSKLTIEVKSIEAVSHPVPYTISQGPQNLADKGTITFNVKAADNPLTAYEDTINIIIPEASEHTINVLSQSTIPDGPEPVNVSIVRDLVSAAGNILTKDSSDNFVYTIKNWQVTNDQFEYRIDKGAYSDTAIIRLNVLWNTKYRPLGQDLRGVIDVKRAVDQGVPPRLEFDVPASATIDTLYGSLQVKLNGSLTFPNGNTALLLPGGKVQYEAKDLYSSVSHQITYTLEQTGARGSTTAPTYESTPHTILAQTKLASTSLTAKDRIIKVVASQSDIQKIVFKQGASILANLRVGLSVNGSAMEFIIGSGVLTGANSQSQPVRVENSGLDIQVTYKAGPKARGDDEVILFFQIPGEEGISVTYTYQVTEAAVIEAYTTRLPITIPDTTTLEINVIQNSIIPGGSEPVVVNLIRGLNSQSENRLSFNGQTQNFTYLVEELKPTTDSFEYEIIKGASRGTGTITLIVAWNTKYKPIGKDFTVQETMKEPFQRGSGFIEFDLDEGAVVDNRYGRLEIEKTSDTVSGTNFFTSIDNRNEIRYIIRDEYKAVDHRFNFQLRQQNASQVASHFARAVLTLDPSSIVLPSSLPQIKVGKSQNEFPLGKIVGTIPGEKIRFGLAVGSNTPQFNEGRGNVTLPSPSGILFELKYTGGNDISLTYQDGVKNSEVTVTVFLQKAGEQQVSFSITYTPKTLTGPSALTIDINDSSGTEFPLFNKQNTSLDTAEPYTVELIPQGSTSISGNTFNGAIKHGGYTGQIVSETNKYPYLTIKVLVSTIKKVVSLEDSVASGIVVMGIRIVQDGMEFTTDLTINIRKTRSTDIDGGGSALTGPSSRTFEYRRGTAQDNTGPFQIYNSSNSNINPRGPYSMRTLDGQGLSFGGVFDVGSGAYTITISKGLSGPEVAVQLTGFQNPTGSIDNKTLAGGSSTFRLEVEQNGAKVVTTVKVFISVAQDGGGEIRFDSGDPAGGGTPTLKGGSSTAGEGNATIENGPDMP